MLGVTLGDEANGVAILDGAKSTQDFVRRFTIEGIPSLWPVHAIIGIRVFEVSPDDVAQLADVVRGRWYLPAADGSDRLVDPTCRGAVTGATRAERRRAGRTP